MNKTINNEINKERRAWDEYHSTYKGCGLCGRVIYDGMFSRFEHLKEFHHIAENAAAYHELTTGITKKPVFKAVIPRKSGIKKLLALKKREQSIGVEYRGIDFMILSEIADYDDDLYQRSIDAATKDYPKGRYAFSGDGGMEP